MFPVLQNTTIIYSRVIHLPVDYYFNSQRFRGIRQHVQNLTGNMKWELKPIIFKTIIYHQLMQNYKSFHIFIIPCWCYKTFQVCVFITLLFLLYNVLYIIILFYKFDLIWKNNFYSMIVLRILSWGALPGSLGWALNSITRVLIRDRKSLDTDSIGDVKRQRMDWYGHRPRISGIYY